jgi:hypothetical protein
MKLTLEMIDEVIERTDCTYKEAKEVLLETEGDVIEAIIKLESKMGKRERVTETFDHVTTDLVDKLKKLLEKGDVNRITIEKNDKSIMDIPVTAGIVGAVIFAPAVITSLLVALGTGHSVKIVKENGEIIDFKEYADKTVDSVKEKSNKMKDKFKKDDEEVTEEFTEEPTEEPVEEEKPEE